MTDDQINHLNVTKQFRIEAMKTLFLEMCIEEFSAPDGLAFQQLQLAKLMGRSAPAGVELDGSNTLSKPTKNPAKGGYLSRGKHIPKAKNPQANKTANDPRSPKDWRKEIYSWALSHHDIFDYSEYRPEFEKTYGQVPHQSTRLHATLATMRASGYFEKLFDGRAKLTAQGRRDASSMLSPFEPGELGLPKVTKLIEDFATAKGAEEFSYTDFADEYSRVYGKQAVYFPIIARLNKAVDNGLLKAVAKDRWVLNRGAEKSVAAEA